MNTTVITVGELVKQLGYVDQSLPIMVSSDPEANGFQPLGYVDTDATFNGLDEFEIETGVSLRLANRDDNQYDPEYDVEPFPCIVLWP